MSMVFHGDIWLSQWDILNEFTTSGHFNREHDDKAKHSGVIWSDHAIIFRYSHFMEFANLLVRPKSMLYDFMNIGAWQLFP